MKITSGKNGRFRCLSGVYPALGYRRKELLAEQSESRSFADVAPSPDHSYRAFSALVYVLRGRLCYCRM